MAREDRIRGLGTFAGSFARRPFAEVLIELLRESASGRLEVGLHPEPRNFVLFREGVPVRVELPDLGPTLVSMLIEEGALSKKDGLELVRLADSIAVTESRVVQKRRLLAGDRLREARRRRAERQLGRLLDERDADFHFEPSWPEVDPAEITLLEPLAVLFGGLCASPEGRAAEPHLPAAPTSVRLSSGYPRGVDPFGFGAALERDLEAGATVASLTSGSHPPEAAKAALACLVLTDMAELSKERPAAPAREPAPPPSLAPEGVADGLVVHRRSGAKVPVKTPGKTPTEAPTQAPTRIPVDMPVGPSAEPERRADLERAETERRRPEAEPAPSARRAGAVEQRLAPFEGKSYFQVLRVGPDTDGSQLERAYRFLARRVSEEARDVGGTALAGLLREAWVYLRDPQRHARYAGARGAERGALEAEPKIERAVRALGDGRPEEARYLVRWASRLAPHRSELGALQAGIDWLAEAPSRRHASPRAALMSEARRTGDRRLKLALAAVCAAEGDERTARALLVDAGDDTHPLAERVLAEAGR